MTVSRAPLPTSPVLGPVKADDAAEAGTPPTKGATENKPYCDNSHGLIRLGST
jgi:hypothetical protein